MATEEEEQEGGCARGEEPSTRGGDTNWGVGSAGFRSILISLLSTWLWQMSRMFVLVSNLHCTAVGEKLSVLTRPEDRRDGLPIAWKENETAVGLFMYCNICIL